MALFCIRHTTLIRSSTQATHSFICSIIQFSQVHSFKTSTPRCRMTSSGRETCSEPNHWLRRALHRTRDVESQQISSSDSVNCIDAGQSIPRQFLDAEAKNIPVLEEALVDVDTASSGLVGLSLTSSPDFTQSSFGLQQQPHPEVTLLHPPRPVLTARHSSAYFTPCDIYGADPGTHTDSIYSNDDAASSRSSLASSTASGFQHLTAPATSTQKRSYTFNPWTLLKTGWRRFTSVFDPQCFWKMIDMREIFFPFTWKRYITLAIIAAVIGGIVVTELFFHWMTAAMAITRKNMLPVLVLVLGLEPIMIVIILMCAKIPNLDTSDAPPSTTEKPLDIEAQGNVRLVL